MEKHNQKPVENKPEIKPPQRPNDRGSIAVQGFFRIFDPQTQKTIVEGRA